MGRMIALRVSPGYEGERSKYADVLKQHARRISKTVDLFSRIKNTDQAEEVFTVLFASRQLKKDHPHHEVAERQLYDYILEWKKTWRTDEKQQALASAIRNLVMLGWMKLQFSENLPEAV
jgi:anaerobic glycerol-3-phosphate dehydrogenase